MLPYGRQTIEEDDIAAVAQALRGDFLTTGPTVEAFEDAFADQVGAQHAVVLQSRHAVARPDRSESVAAQIGVEDLGDFGLVFDDQDKGVVHGFHEPGDCGGCAQSRSSLCASARGTLTAGCRLRIA